MSLHALATEWGTDGPIGLAFTLLAVASGLVYLLAAEIGRRRDRRRRRWPLRRSACFIGGLAVLVVDLDSGIGSLADDHLAAHMIEHMVMWLIVAPLLAAGGPGWRCSPAVGTAGDGSHAGCTRDR
jgi:cytochrome c oxidase assembly factor CtaG